MSSGRYIDKLADRLDQVLPPHSPALPDAVSPDEPLVALAARLARGPHPALSAGAEAQIEKRILAHAARMQPARRLSRHRGTLRVLRWAVAASLVLVIVLMTAASASADSVPGDSLYPVKRLVEDARLAAAGDGSDVGLRLEFAQRRLDEFETLLERGEVNFETLDDAINDMNATLSLVERGYGSSDATLARLLDISERHMELVALARTQVNADPDKLDQLQYSVADAGAVQEKARRLAAPPTSESPQSRRLPEAFQLYNERQNLAANQPVPVYTPAPGGDTTVFMSPSAAPQQVIAPLPQYEVPAPSSPGIKATPEPGDPMVSEPDEEVTRSAAGEDDGDEGNDSDEDSDAGNDAGGDDGDTAPDSSGADTPAPPVDAPSPPVDWDKPGLPVPENPIVEPVRGPAQSVEPVQAAPELAPPAAPAANELPTDLSDAVDVPAPEPAVPVEPPQPAESEPVEAQPAEPRSAHPVIQPEDVVSQDVAPVEPEPAAPVEPPQPAESQPAEAQPAEPCSSEPPAQPVIQPEDMVSPDAADVPVPEPAAPVEPEPAVPVEPPQPAESEPVEAQPAEPRSSEPPAQPVIQPEDVVSQDAVPAQPVDVIAAPGADRPGRD